MPRASSTATSSPPTYSSPSAGSQKFWILDWQRWRTVQTAARESEVTMTRDQPEHLTSPGSAVGTVAYMSPEQIRGKEVDARSDLFFHSVWCSMRWPPEDCAFVAILQEPPLMRSSTSHQLLPFRLNPDVPDGLERIINKALEKNQDIRYQHASELRADLKRLRRDTESGSRATVPAATHPQARRSLLLWAAAAVMAVGVAAGVTFMLRRSGPPATPNSLQWVQLTNFTDSVSGPSLSPDGRMLTFIRGSENFGTGQVYARVFRMANRCNLPTMKPASGAPHFHPMVRASPIAQWGAIGRHG